MIIDKSDNYKDADSDNVREEADVVNDCEGCEDDDVGYGDDDDHHLITSNLWVDDAYEVHCT